MKLLLLPLLAALSLPTVVNAERDGWRHIFTNKNDEMLYIRDSYPIFPKEKIRYREFETKLYTNEEVIQRKRKLDCKEKRIYFPSKFRWISVNENSLTNKMYQEVCRPENEHDFMILILHEKVPQFWSGSIKDFKEGNEQYKWKTKSTYKKVKDKKYCEELGKKLVKDGKYNAHFCFIGSYEFYKKHHSKAMADELWEGIGEKIPNQD
tara:strand:+ start:727 stop:1350 length:624 start_codon:yes stop_codon:yes gene_type:complete